MTAAMVEIHTKKNTVRAMTVMIGRSLNPRINRNTPISASFGTVYMADSSGSKAARASRLIPIQ